MLTQQPVPTTWERVQSYASDAEAIIDAPVDDLAAVLGFEAAWLAGFLLGVKFVWLGLHKEFGKR
jgi:hypothetical protein